MDKLIAIRIFIPNKERKNHNCFKKVSKEEFYRFLAANPDLEEDFYMDQNSFYDKEMVMLAKVVRYGTDEFYIRKCFVKHRRINPDKTKGHWQKIICETSGGLTINYNK